MKKKNGFTLIELLVTIALMLSLLAIAIVSVVNVSKKKKEEAYQTVKEQVLTAAQDYFDANEYLFEGLSDSVSGYITLNQLVSDDYLNVLTNPQTGKKLNGCDKVKITRTNGRNRYEFEEGSGDASCSYDNIISISDTGGPEISIKILSLDDGEKIPEIDIYPTTYLPEDEKYESNLVMNMFQSIASGEIYKVKGTLKKEDKNNIYYNEKLKIKVIAENNKGGQIYQVGIKKSDSDTVNENQYVEDSTYEDVSSYVTSTSNKTTTYIAINKDGKKAIMSTTLNVDLDAPTCEFSPNNNGYFNLNDEIKLFCSGGECKDNNDLLLYSIGRGGSSNAIMPLFIKTNNNVVKLTEVENTTGDMVYGVVADEAGNINICSEYFKIDSQAPYCTIPEENGATNGWKNNSSHTVKGICNDTNCKSDEVTKTITLGEDGVNKEVFNSYVTPGEVEDESGKKAPCPSVEVKLDIEKPMINIKINDNSNNGKQQNRSFSLEFSDKYSGINIDETKYSINGGSPTKYTGTKTVLTNTGTATIYAKTKDNAGNENEAQTKTLVCNKDRVKVDQSGSGCNFKLSFSLPNSPTGVVSNKYEYVVWNKVSTSDSENNRKTHEEARSDCLNVPTSGRVTVTTNQTNNISMLKNTYNMYYCFAVRPVRNDRTNLTGIGNFYRQTLYIDSNPNTSNTGWTIERKPAHVSSKCS